MIATLRSRNFALLWFGALISMTGDWMLFIALPVYIYDLTDSTLATGLMFVALTVPRVLLGSVAGVFVDRWDRRKTMVSTSALMGANLLPLLLLRSTDTLWIVYIVAVVQSILSQFFGPAENALLPKLVSEKHLLPANALNALNNNLARLIGPAVGGIIVSQFGLQGVVVADTACLWIAALMIVLINVSGKPEIMPGSEPDAAASWRKVWLDWREGVRLIRRDRVLTLLFIVLALSGIGEGLLNVLLVPFVTRVLGGEAPQLGWLMSAQAVGGILGGIVIGSIGQRIAPLRLLAFSLTFFGLLDLTIFNYSRFVPGFELGLILFVIVGIPVAGLGAAYTTLMQVQVSDQFRGRIFSALMTTFALFSLGGMGLSSVFGDVVGIVPMVSLMALLHIAAGLLTFARQRELAVPALQQTPV